MSDVKLFLFGPPRIERAGTVVDMNLRKGLALLAYLATSREVHSRDALAALFWPESDQSRARANLRRTLYELKEAIGADLLQATADTIGLQPEASIWVDTAVFREKVDACLPSSAQTSSFTPDCLTHLADAASLFHDQFLAGFSLPDSPAFDEWQFFQQEDLRHSLIRVLQLLIAWHSEQANYDTALEYGRRWLALDLWHEPAHRALMRLYTLAGQQAAALRQYEQCVQILDEELDIDPQAETAALYEAIKTGAFPLRAGSVTGELVIESQTEVELPTSPERFPHNLPRQLTPFLGRKSELSILARFVENRQVQLISIVGPGGMGKTRLALALADRYAPSTASSSRFPDGIFFVGLDLLADAGRLVPAIAAALRLSLDEDDPEAAQRQLLATLGTKQLLLILDNFEHLLPQGTPLLASILRECPHVDILVTSRERLYLREEHLLVIEGLELPALETQEAEAGAYPALQLFAQRARAVQHDFALTSDNIPAVIRLCRLVGGMPLALELAAAWIDVLAPVDIVAEIRQSLDILQTNLRNIPSRQRSLRAVFDSTWQRLEPAEQKTFAQLSIFRGGFTREAARRVAIGQGDPVGSLPVLSHLADKCLLRFDRDNRRYHIHHLLRQYGEEQLNRDVELSRHAHARHQKYFVRFLQQRAQDLTAARQGEAIAAIAAETENIRLALGRAIEQVDLPAIRQAIYPFYLFCDFQGRFRENAALMEQAIAGVKSLDPGPERDQTLAELLTLQGYNYLRLGRLDEVQTAAERALAIYRGGEMEPPVGFGTDPLICLGHLANVRGYFEEAQRLGQAAREQHEARGDRLNLQIALYGLTDAEAALGHYEEARHYARQAYLLTQETGNRWMTAYVLGQLGSIDRALGNYDQARRHYQASYEVKEAFDDPEGMAAALNDIGNVAWMQGAHQEAHAYFQRSLATYREINDQGGLATSLQGLAETDVARQRYQDARIHFHEALAVAAAMQFTTRLLSILVGVSRLFRATEQVERGAELLGLVLHHPAATEATRQQAELLLVHYQSAMTRSRVEAAVQRGTDLDLLAMAQRLAAELMV